MKKEINSLLIDKDSSIKSAIRVIDREGCGTAFVIDRDKKLLGVVTDGDIRRAILRGINIEKPIKEIANKEPVFIREEHQEKELLEIKMQKDIKKKIPIGGSLKVPVVTNKGEVKDIVFIYLDKANNPRLSNGDLKFIKGIKKVLLVGGAGYFGSVLCRELIDKNFDVRVFDNLTYGDDGIKELYGNKSFEFLKGDIRSISNTVEAIKGVDAVIHLAAIVGDPACEADPKETLETNYLATKNIIEACKYFQINRFIFASTCSVYGKSPLPDQKLTEESLLNPVSLYAETKIKCENAILEAMDENFSPTILRMATLYGYSPNMRFDLVVNLLTGKAIFDKKITILGGEQWRPWLHLEDAAKAYIACLGQPIEKIRGEVFNILSENYKIIDVGKIINSVCPEAKIEISDNIIDERNYNVSFDKISQMLNYQPSKKISDEVLKIKNVINKGLIKDYKDPKYRTLLI